MKTLALIAGIVLCYKLDRRHIKKAVLAGTTVMCTKHTGNALLLWSNGDALCYDCGTEKYGSE